MQKLILSSLIILTLPLSANAQEVPATESTTGSGTVIERSTSDILQNILNIAPSRIPKNVKQLTIPEKVESAFQKEFTSIRQRMAEQRTACREAIRKANRDQRMGKVAQCQRALLMLDMNMLRKQSDYISILPFVDAQLKETATGAIANLESAEMTIVDGIDTQLFTQEAQLIAARNNLRVTYREPVWMALMKIRIDRELTNIIFISKLLNERSDVEISTHLLPIAQCLESTKSSIEMAKNASDRMSAGAEWAVAKAKAAECRGLIQTLARADRQATTSAGNP